ncbi:nitrate- and nitrite sensing domain-containing protein [Streptomyces sp. NPDC051940]|uniref:sensor histidine kinase n=1 Tax=Streptomyces sp. NPDC051940 TaxID=3155675 RepID=UPI0034345433
MPPFAQLPLRTLLRILAAIVTAALAALVVAGTVPAFQHAGELRDQARTLERNLPPLQALITELQTERSLTAARVAKRSVSQAVLDTQRTRTDAALAGTGTKRRAVAQIREAADARNTDAPTVIDRYTDEIAKAVEELEEYAAAGDADQVRQTRALVGLVRVTEAVRQEDALLAAAEDGRLTAGAQTAFGAAVAVQRQQATDVVAAYLPDAEKTGYGRLAGSAAWSAKQRTEDRVVTAHRLPAADDWRAVHDEVVSELTALTTGRITAMAQRVDDRAAELRERAFWLSLGGFAGAVAVVALVLAVTRHVSRRAEEVRSSALDVARRQLPQLIVRVQHGEPADLSELPAQTRARDEFAELSNVVARLTEEVVDAAKIVYAERRGFEKFAEGVTLRAVTLIVAMLKTLDELQHRYADTDPALLNELYQMDHLTVRVRRQLENLLVLSGGAVANPHTEPVHIANLIVDAAGESRGYAHVVKEFHAEAWIVPDAAGELTHLIAELIENATTYSPSGYEVFVRATEAVTGVAIEVEDKGRAPDAWHFEALNGRLLDVPPYSVLGESADQLGLFVVGQLAQRHGVKVSLGEGRFGGVRAVALIPHALLTAEPAGGPEPEALRAARATAVPRGPKALPAQRGAPPVQTTAAGLIRRRPAEPAEHGRAVEADAPPGAARETAPTGAERATAPTSAARDAAAQVTALPQRVPGRNLARQLREESADTTAAPSEATAVDDSPLDTIETTFTQLQHALTNPEKDTDR